MEAVKAGEAHLDECTQRAAEILECWARKYPGGSAAADAASLRQWDEDSYVIVAGSTNSGKSSLICKLLGADLAKVDASMITNATWTYHHREAPAPDNETPQQPKLSTNGVEKSFPNVEALVEHVRIMDDRHPFDVAIEFPSETLRDLQAAFVDTPGVDETNTEGDPVHIERLLSMVGDKAAVVVFLVTAQSGILGPTHVRFLKKVPKDIPIVILLTQVDLFQASQRKDVEAVLQRQLGQLQRYSTEALDRAIDVLPMMILQGTFLATVNSKTQEAQYWKGFLNNVKEKLSAPALLRHQKKFSRILKQFFNCETFNLKQHAECPIIISRLKQTIDSVISNQVDPIVQEKLKLPWRKYLSQHLHDHPLGGGWVSEKAYVEAVVTFLGGFARTELTEMISTEVSAAVKKAVDLELHQLQLQLNVGSFTAGGSQIYTGLAVLMSGGGILFQAFSPKSIGIALNGIIVGTVAICAGVLSLASLVTNNMVFWRYSTANDIALEYALQSLQQGAIDLGHQTQRWLHTMLNARVEEIKAQLDEEEKDKTCMLVKLQILLSNYPDVQLAPCTAPNTTTSTTCTTTTTSGNS
ncbi:hypothetical protein Pelo_17305 [Pelomyxa schiedti]|nr:hypothetical protein Pelo_17305 [Pelomyxa schiedti]